MFNFISYQRKIIIFLSFIVLIIFSIKADTPNSSTTSSSLADIIDPLLPAIVSISTTTRYHQREIQLPLDIPLPKGYLLEEFLRELFGKIQTERSLPRIGSGFIVDNKGHVVTNNYLVEDAEKITVTLNDNTELKAILVGRDPQTDIAVLKIKSSRKLPFIQWGDSGKLRIGDPVIAIGNPFGLGSTVTAGIVSYLARNMDQIDDFMGEYIQTDAGINPGGAGGPLCDVKGKVVGINTGYFSFTGENIGIGFAIPSKVAKKIIKQILHYGRVKRGWLGLNIQDITLEIAEGLNLKDPKGVLINKVIKNGPAEKAQLRRGDVILKLANKEINNQRSLLKIEEGLPIDSQILATIFRNGTILIIPIKIVDAIEARAIAFRETEKDFPSEEEIYGMILQDLTGDTRRQFDISCDIQGVLIFDVIPKTPAAERGIRPGDIVIEVNQEEVTTLQHVINLLKKIGKEDKKHVLLLINRNGESRYISLLNIST